MAVLKPSEISKYLAKPNFTIPIHLIFGTDRGLVTERANSLACATKIDLKDPFATIKIDANDIGNDPERLMNEAYTVPMFGDQRLIWVQGAGNDVGLVKQIERLLTNPPTNTPCIIEAGDLKKGTKLRSLIEGSKTGLAIACYADSDREITSILDDVLSKNKLKISLDARVFLLSQLGADRLSSRMEIDKLCLYMGGQTKINIDDIRAVMGDASALSNDEIVDAIIVGDVTTFDRAISRFFSSGGTTHELYSACLRQFIGLEKMREQMELDGKSASLVVNNARPIIFYARKKPIETALNKWSTGAVRIALERLQSAVLESRKTNILAKDITYMTLLGLTIQASRR